MFNHISGAVGVALHSPPPLVRRNSVPVDKEPRRPITRREVEELLHHAEELEAATRPPGCSNGVVSKPGLAVLRVLCRRVDFATGQCCPDLDTLAVEAQCSTRTVSRALRKLQAIGFANWTNRYVGTGRRGFCPQVRQASNGYTLMLPERVVEAVAVLPGPKERAEVARAERNAVRHARAEERQEVRARLRAERLARAKVLADATMPPPALSAETSKGRSAELARFDAVLKSTGLYSQRE